MFIEGNSALVCMYIRERERERERKGEREREGRKEERRGHSWGGWIFFCFITNALLFLHLVLVTTSCIVVSRFEFRTVFE